MTNHRPGGRPTGQAWVVVGRSLSLTFPSVSIGKLTSDPLARARILRLTHPQGRVGSGTHAPTEGRFPVGGRRMELVVTLARRWLPLYWSLGAAGRVGLCVNVSGHLWRLGPEHDIDTSSRPTHPETREPSATNKSSMKR